MKESRIQLRAQMEANRSIPASGPVFDELVKGMDEAAHMLRHEIVRGNLNEETGRYGRYKYSSVFCFGQETRQQEGQTALSLSPTFAIEFVI